MRRGDIVTVAPPGEFGKPRPALIIQANPLPNDFTVTFIPLSSSLGYEPMFHVSILPTSENGLDRPSEIMVDRIQTSTLGRVGRHIGQVDVHTMRRVETALMIHLGLA